MDLRPLPLEVRKATLQRAVHWTATIRYGDHVAGHARELFVNACRMGLEGIVCKRAADPYRPGRGPGWVKVKCGGREELVVLGWTPPAGSRQGFGALHVGYFDGRGALHYAGGVGSGFDADDLATLRTRLDGLAAPPPTLQSGGDPVDGAIAWVRPEIVIEVKYTGWSGAGRLRHAVFLGIRPDKLAADVVRPIADPDAPRQAVTPKPGPAHAALARRAWHGAIPPPRAPAMLKPASRIVSAKPPQKPQTMIGHVALTHPEKPLWPGITKQDLARYWQEIAPRALPGLAHRPLSILRCPDGIAGETFFQKNGHGALPVPIHEGRAGTQPYLTIEDVDGLFAMTQMSAIELHAWGAPDSDPTRPDRLVFDLDPGETVAFPTIVAAALEVRARLAKLGLDSFCRTTGGKGLHVVVPLDGTVGWDAAKPFARAFAETLAQDAPDRYVAHLKIADRHGRILVDWLRNGLGATAVASYSPRARPGAGVATPLAWREVTPKLDPTAFTLATVPARLAKQSRDPWQAWSRTRQSLPALTLPDPKPAGSARIVTARKPKPKA